MNICLIIGSLTSGGAERVAATLANYWVQKGWKVTMIITGDGKEDFYQLDDRIQKIILSADMKRRHKLESIKNYFVRLARLRKILLSIKPDAALGFMPASNILCSIASLRTGLNVFGSEHSHPPFLKLNDKKGWLLARKISYRWLNAVSSLTNDSAKYVEALTGSKDNPIVPNPILYPIPVQNPVIQPSAVKREIGGEYFLLAVGRFANEKGFDRLLNAFAQISPAFSEWRLIILGDGELRSALEKQRAQLGLERKVAMPGVVGNISDWYAAVDMYVMSSRYEGFGNTLAEALCYGVPSVAVDCDAGPRDIITHNIDGLLVEQDNLQALQNGLSQLMADESLRRSFSKNAIAARGNFSVARVANIWEDIFKRY